MSQRQITSLATLPQELTDNITSHLVTRGDLSNLSKTCKTIRAAVLATLYENITMVVYGTYNECTHRPAKVPPMNFFLQTLLENPKLAHHVRSIEFKAIGHRIASQCGIKPPLPPMAHSPSFAPLVEETTQRLRLTKTSMAIELVNGVLENDFHAVTALILLLCQNVVSVTLGLDFLIRNPFLAAVIECAVPRGTGTDPQDVIFQSLKVLEMGTNLDPKEDTDTFRVLWPRRLPGDILRLKNYLPLFYLPVVERLVLSLPALEPGVQFRWPAESAPLSKLTSLLLPECSVPPEILRKVLASTPYLVRLEYDCSLHTYERFDASAFEAGLDLVKDTLVHLETRIHFWSRETVQPMDEEEVWVTNGCSLRGMRALRHVSLPICVLLGWEYATAARLAEALPPDLLTLRLQGDFCYYAGDEWDEERLTPCLQTFIADGNWTLSTPMLQRIVVAYGHDGFEEASLLEDAFSASGLELVIGSKYP
ncbi:hypothetical protein DM02DRAFT_666141 [Periconia macrospinosa]|uniref:F-box domain-containing protein n=1 Tax=Periconia macrospinosa TaxID=97972 RepID=A0A2V1EDH2_9PLEO|nr:hypothetical protein DM02DRAFT_666141 [Periconia macrospinosa]